MALVYKKTSHKHDLHLKMEKRVNGTLILSKHESIHVENISEQVLNTQFPPSGYHFRSLVRRVRRVNVTVSPHFAQRLTMFGIMKHLSNYFTHEASNVKFV